MQVEVRGTKIKKELKENSDENRAFLSWERGGVGDKHLGCIMYVDQLSTICTANMH